MQHTFSLYPSNANELTDRSWVKATGGARCLKSHKAAFFGFLLPGALKVLLQHPPAACWIDEALLMGRHLLGSVRMGRLHEETSGWSLFSSAQPCII